MVTGSNTDTSEEIVEHREEGSLELKRSGKPAIDRGHRSEGEGDDGDDL